MDQLKKAIMLTIHHQRKFYISMDVTFNEHSFFYVDSTLQGDNESEVHNHDVSMFDILDI